MTEKIQRTASGMQAVAAVMASAGDAARSGQAEQLGGKLAEGLLTVALCGHFSAGKSTLVNQLCGAKLLPSSPIPTSANVVSIRGGKRAYAEVEKVLADGSRIQAEVQIEQLDQYCVDGEQFASVSIVYPSDLLGDSIVILDTPGIDSTDDAHRMATESALHLADVVFYVMDYNHVQSEINFAFAKELKDWGKPLYFIVNQIDKHRDRELSFDSYRRSVEQAFQAWHLEPAGIVYLSLRQPEHAHHEWDKLIGLIGALAEQRKRLCAYSVDASVRHLAKAHMSWRKELAQPERKRLLAAAGGEGAAAELAAEMSRLRAVVSTLEEERETYRAGLRKELQSVLDNANITPAGLRDLAHAFLESRKSGFKMGLLFAGGKTAAEQERRLVAFRDELTSLISAAIAWHLKQLLRDKAQHIRFDGERLEAMLAEALDWLPDQAWLIERVKSGAVFGNEYTMTYSRELAADVKAEFRRRSLPIIEELESHAAGIGDEATADARRQLSLLGERAGAFEALMAIDSRLKEAEAELNALLPVRVERPALPKPEQAAEAVFAGAAAARAQAPAMAAAEARASVAERLSAAARQASPAAEAVAVRPGGAALNAAGARTTALAKQQAAAEKLAAAARLLEPHASLRNAARAMTDKAQRLSNSRFTIALFGAFSAGKSSLANALIGEAVLPVSPNPTTAAINRLMPPTKEYSHGTARVVMKSREAVISDLRYSLALLGEDASDDRLPDADDIIRVIDRLTPQSIGAGGRPHYSFLRAARAGWERHAPLLGKELKTDRSEYAQYVADESRSCFVSEIDFHYDCPLTEEGIVLVDTPGADSVNARHTGVAFNYIKNADAVLFVTYYNHAFSQADRQFLDQLGRVKDQFELDKMFFIVNAADLAADEAELQGVLAHVESNLLKHSIVSPRLFPISSIDALDGKLDGNGEQRRASRIDAFEHAFLSFIRNDLGRMAIESAEMELKRTAATVAGWLRNAEGDAEDRVWQLDMLEQSERAAEAPIRELSSSALPEGLKQESNELLYYVVQRLQYRFGDFYHFAFNPSSLQDDGRELKRVIWTAWLELQRLLQRELSQELHATTLRLERALHSALNRRYDDCRERLVSLLQGYEPAPYEASAIAAPLEPAAWEAAGIDVKWLWSRFKSPRQFFEGEGKSAMRRDLEAELGPSLQRWIHHIAADWIAHYESAWHTASVEAGGKLDLDMHAYCEGMRGSMNDANALAELRTLHDRLIHL